MSSYNFSDDVCVICCDVDDTKGPLQKVTRGLHTLIDFSGKHGDHNLTDYLLSNPSVVMVHGCCRKTYTTKRNFDQAVADSQASESNKRKSLRSSAVSFDWKQHCFICGEVAQVDVKHPDRSHVTRVESLTIHNRMKELCAKRNDQLGEDVLRRLNSCVDLVAAEGRYHPQCASKLSHIAYQCIKNLVDLLTYRNKLPSIGCVSGLIQLIANC